jgi:hypothetical protein
VGCGITGLPARRGPGNGIDQHGNMGKKQEETTMAYDIQQVIKMSQAELDQLFSNGEVGEIPDGEAKGTAIIAPGTPYTYAVSQVINFFAWQGKMFDAKTGTLKNEVSPFGFRAIIAKVYKGDSWFDHKPCIVLDYSETSMVAHRIRDEIRKVADKQYIGKVYWGEKHLIEFFLQF